LAGVEIDARHWVCRILIVNLLATLERFSQPHLSILVVFEPFLFEPVAFEPVVS
jgi:hypothetical protein